MFQRLRILFADRLRSADHAAHLTGFQLGLVSALCLALTALAMPVQTASAHLPVASGGAPRLSMALGGAPPQAQPVDTAQPADDLIRLQDMSAEQARAWNASNPVSKLPNPAAKPFNLKAEGVMDEARATDCMTAAVYYEAAYESLEGQRAVAQVVLNRMRHPSFPKTVCGVVFQGSERATGCQFTFTCDGALARNPDPVLWERARKVAEAALHGYVMKKVGNATHYHAVYVAPYWSPTLVKVQTIGAHIFYRWTGTAGLPPAFGGRYAGGESKGLQIATLDKLSAGRSKLALTPVSDAPAAATPAAVEESAPPGKPVVAPPAEELVTASAVAKDAGTLAKAEDLDWQGRPKAKAAPRLAMPSSGMGF